MTGACHSSARYLIVFLGCRFVATRVDSANSSWPCAYGRARRRVANPSIVIECSDRLTTARRARRAFSAPYLPASFIAITYSTLINCVTSD